MLFTRTFALARTTARASPSPALALRAFSVAAPARRDIIKDLYLNEIRNYKAPANIAADTSSLVSAFAQPTAPAAPALEADVITYGEDAAAAEAEWPALVDPIEDHHFINDEWDFICRADDGGVLFPKRLKPYDYSGDHH
ncbi:hypothetical protein HDU78_011699 [Chytriomyces hyalinus]|uniref:Uncharacterized protein n=1 Tax=Chytriomyces confervae TaxID=246404 RepID=A0A507FIJ8_9FUNG|nr:hypothetical protein BJ741DRAFT_704558 [Chytriomyces cf. hyalinus JEL632]KAJ3243868.1 hypothetical protein HDU78_011699 [Chytriomyces hyalinus]KAJ3402758.1 hypothetical protein HDU80_004792 [Chytriomyces hyalinus]TPX76229.1 hypothetical protein CcCBS67573_g02507 [Chytriomyces confervae]